MADESKSAGPGEPFRDRDGLTVYNGVAECEHQWVEVDDVIRGGEVEVAAHDICVQCGGVKY